MLHSHYHHSLDAVNDNRYSPNSSPDQYSHHPRHRYYSSQLNYLTF